MIRALSIKKALGPPQERVNRDACRALLHLITAGLSQEGPLPFLNPARGDVGQLDRVDLFYPAFPAALLRIKPRVSAVDLESVTQDFSKRDRITDERFGIEIRFRFELLEKIANGRMSLKDRKSTRLNSSHQIISYAVF